MNTILINLGSELKKIEPLMKEIKGCKSVIELPNDTWIISSDNDVKWWNNYIFSQLNRTYANLEQSGSIRKAYFLCSAKDICGCLDIGITAKLRELKKTTKPTKEIETIPIQNILDRMDVE